jgi:heme/copper-type cytochrome/quinol oxidase subunit 1
VRRKARGLPLLEQLKQLEGQFTAVATTHGFTRAFLWSTFLMLGAAVVTIVGLSIKHKDLATDGQSPVHMG